MVTSKAHRSSQVVFLLGAGASVDAGLPDVARLSRELWSRLPHMRDVNGQPCPAIRDVFDRIATVDREVAENYERFFDWTRLLLDANKKPFRELLRRRAMGSGMPFAICDTYGIEPGATSPLAPLRPPSSLALTGG